MTRRNRLLLLALGMSLAPGVQVARAEGGFHLGASLGSARLDDDFAGLEVDDRSTAYRITGGWRFDRHFGVEVGWQDFGDFEQRFEVDGDPLDVSLGADGYTLGMTGRYPLGARFELLARLGAFFWDGDAEIGAIDQADPGDTNPYFGAGLGFDVGRGFLLRGDWSRYELEDTRSDVWSLGVEYRF